MIEIQHICRVKIVRIDNGSEFLMSDFYSSKGIENQLDVLKLTNKMGEWK